MKKRTKVRALISAALLLAFILWTALVCIVDVQAIGPNGSSVGLAKLNGFVHSLSGVHFSLYIVTDWLGLVPIFVALGFAVVGLSQWIKRKSFLGVDKSLLALGVFYIIVATVYIAFESATVNYRPILINGYLEKSYPSSTTLLVACVMPTAITQLNFRIKNKAVKRCVAAVIALFVAFMVVARLISGVHWVSDIIGGALLSAALVTAYNAICSDI